MNEPRMPKMIGEFSTDNLTEFEVLFIRHLGRHMADIFKRDLADAMEAGTLSPDAIAYHRKHTDEDSVQALTNVYLLLFSRGKERLARERAAAARIWPANGLTLFRLMPIRSGDFTEREIADARHTALMRVGRDTDHIGDQLIAGTIPRSEFPRVCEWLGLQDAFRETLTGIYLALLGLGRKHKAHERAAAPAEPAPPPTQDTVDYLALLESFRKYSAREQDAVPAEPAPLPTPKRFLH